MLTEIENLSYAELKARRSELTEAAEKAPVKELAARYIKARSDAAGRDEKLSEQGRTIAVLQEAVEAGKAAQANLRSAIEANKALSDKLQAAQAELKKSSALAKARRIAVAEVVKMLSPVLVDEA